MNELQILLQSAAGHCHNHDCEEAIDALDKVVRFHPRIAEPHYSLGVCYSGSCQKHSLVDMGLAVAHLKHAIKLFDEFGNSLALARSVEVLANTYMMNCTADPSINGKAAIEFSRKAAAIYRGQGWLIEAAESSITSATHGAIYQMPSSPINGEDLSITLRRPWRSERSRTILDITPPR